jgi:hypothetical protein
MNYDQQDAIAYPLHRTIGRLTVMLEKATGHEAQSLEIAIHELRTASRALRATNERNTA